MLQWILPVLTLSSIAFALPAEGGDALPPVRVAENVDLERYVGLWYELARTPNVFQLGCACTTAYYTVLDESSIGIRNACNNFFPRASLRVAEGLGVVPDPSESLAKLRIGFFGGPTTADYWILDVVDDPDDPLGPYRFAVVGDPNRDFLFILSRSPRPRSVADNAAIEEIFERLEEQQYPTSRLRRTRQPRRCTYAGSAPE
jgi:apolipoprotein D and lipocalin family protein